MSATIIDDGGIDTFDFAEDTEDQEINLASGGVSTVFGVVGNFVIFFGKVIENAYAGSGNDVLYGNEVANILHGNDGNDLLDGKGGADVLVGGLGHDILTGGAGADNFIFDSALSATNIDTITDFDTNEDTIILGANVFRSLGGGALDATNLRIAGTGAADADDYILYNPNNGVIYYDADATGGSHNWVAFARVDPGTVPDADDFFIL